jgi:hypothetical protein
VKFGENGLNINNKEVLGEWSKGAIHTVWPKDLQAMAPIL